MTLHHVPVGQANNLLSISLPPKRKREETRATGHGIAKVIHQLRDRIAGVTPGSVASRMPGWMAKNRCF